jgi:hypothetical protein
MRKFVNILGYALIVFIVNFIIVLILDFLFLSITTPAANEKWILLPIASSYLYLKSFLISSLLYALFLIGSNKLILISVHGLHFLTFSIVAFMMNLKDGNTNVLVVVQIVSNAIVTLYSIRNRFPEVGFKTP